MSEQLATIDRSVVREVYETELANGQRYAQAGAMNEHRWKHTLAFVPKQIESMLDCGCDVGQWLNYVTENRTVGRAVGIDVARNKIERGRELFGHLDLRVGYVEDLLQLSDRYEVVTLLEVLEHVEQWQGVLDAALSLATKRVIATVPYREKVVQSPCIHCGQLTPLYGHLRSYDESCFEQRDGWLLEFGYIRRSLAGAPGLLRKVYRLLRRRPGWLVVCYTRCG